MENLFVLLDNGHGEDTPGKCSPDHSIKEWWYTRIITNLLDNALNEQGIPSMRIVPEDQDIPLGGPRNKKDCRIKRVNDFVQDNKKKGLDTILLSIHLDAASNGTWNKARGMSTWVAPNSSKRSKTLANTIIKTAKEMNLTGNRSIPKCGYWEGNFAIVRDTLCPAVLVECAFQDNKDDVAFLLSEEGKQKIVECIIKSIKDFEKID